MPVVKTDKGYKIVANTATTTTPKTKTSTSASAAGLRAKEKETQQFLKLAEKAGMTKVVEEFNQPPKLSALQRLGRGLTSFETGDALYASMYEQQPFLKEYAKNITQGLGSMVTGKDYSKDPKKTFKDILQMEGMRDRPGKLDAVDLAGFALDVALDPTTYLGGVVGKGVLKGIKGGAKLATKVPVIGPGLKAAGESAADLFKPFAKIERLGEEGKKYHSAYLQHAKSTRSGMNDFMEEMSKRAKSVKKIPQAGTKIGQAVETGFKTGSKMLDDITDELLSIQNKFTVEEKSRGILEKTLDNYMHHMLTPEARDFMNKGGDLAGSLKSFRVKLGAAKERTIMGDVVSINKNWQTKFGHNLFEENAFAAFGKRGIESIKNLKTYDFLQNVGRTFGKQAEKDFIDDAGIRWVESSAPQLKGFRLPKPIKDHVDEINRVLTNDEATNKFLGLYDKVQNFWKVSVTGWFPAFHTRNALSGTFNNWLAGLNNPAHYATAEKILRGGKGSITTKAGKVLSFDDIRLLVKEWGVSGQSGFLDVTDYLQKTVSPKAMERIVKLPQKVMGAVEDRLRVPLFIDGLKKGMSAEEAAKRVIKYHFDYTPEGLTAFEKNVLRRIIPFYTFTRNNIPLQLEQVIMKPGKYAGVFKAVQSLGVKPSSEEESVMPRWMREQFTFSSGESGYLSNLGLPIEEAAQKLSNPLRGVGISLSPLIKTPLERLTNYNIFKERKISEDVWAKEYRNIPEPIQKWLEFKENKGKNDKTYYTVNPHKKYWLEVIGSRGLSTALRIANSSEDRQNIWSLIIPLRRYDYNEDDLRSWVSKEKLKKIEESLYNAGLLRKFEKFYEPKD